LSEAFEGAHKLFSGFREFIGRPQVSAGTQGFLIILAREAGDGFGVGIGALFYEIVGLLQAKINSFEVARELGAVRRWGAILKKVLLMFGSVAQCICRNEVTRRGKRRASRLVAARKIKLG
jgi:hypothetical protein